MTATPTSRLEYLLPLLCALFLVSPPKDDGKKYPYFKEELIYTLKYLNIPAASLTFYIPEVTQIRGRTAYHLVVKAQTRSIFSSLFKVQNVYESFFDVETAQALYYKKDIRQKNLNHVLTIEYDQQHHTARTREGFSWSIPEMSLDVFSMMYFLRTQPLNDGDTLQWNLDVETIPWRVTAKVEQRKRLNLPAGKFPAIKVRLKFHQLRPSRRPWKTDLLTNRLANSTSDLILWFSDDERKIPLLIQFHHSIFDVKAILQKDNSSPRSFGEP